MTELMSSLCNDCVARNQCGNDDVKMCISYTKETKIQCDDCKFVEDCVDYGWDGCRKFTPKPGEPMTNEEWIKSCTTEQLAEWIVSTNRCKTDHLCAVCRQKWCEKKYVVEWLKQPHSEVAE